MIRKLFHIAAGWGKRMGYLEITPAEEKLAELRARICDGCPERGTSTVLILLHGKGSTEKTDKCMKCSCPIREKTIVTAEACPLKKW